MGLSTVHIGNLSKFKEVSLRAAVWPRPLWADPCIHQWRLHLNIMTCFPYDPTLSFSLRGECLSISMKQDYL